MTARVKLLHHAKGGLTCRRAAPVLSRVPITASEPPPSQGRRASKLHHAWSLPPCRRNIPSTALPTAYSESIIQANKTTTKVPVRAFASARDVSHAGPLLQALQVHAPRPSGAHLDQFASPHASVQLIAVEPLPRPIATPSLNLTQKPARFLPGSPAAPGPAPPTAVQLDEAIALCATHACNLLRTTTRVPTIATHAHTRAFHAPPCHQNQ